MPIEITDEQSQVRQMQSNVRAELPNLDPSTEKASFITGLAIAFAKGVHHFMMALQDFANRQVHPQTATGSVLFRGWWTALTSIQRAPITAAQGYVIAIGEAGAIIPLDATFSANGLSYVTTASSTVLNQTVRASTLTFSNGTAIFETVSSHGLASGQEFTISGALDEAYNGVFEITVTAENEFTYTPTSNPVVAAGSGTLAAAAFAKVPVRCETSGQESNIDGGSITFDTAIEDVESSALVTFGGISGGTDLEEQEPFRERLLDALASTLGVFTADEIRDVVKNIPGVTRVWIRKAQIDPENGWPDEGQTKILFMRDDDANPFPSSQEVEAVRAELISKLLPAHSAEEDLIVIAPTPVKIDFSFNSISPDSASMRLAITNQLDQFFEENIGIGADLPKRSHSDLLIMDLNCAIKNTIDLETGQSLNSFDLATPSSDTTTDPDSLPTLGTVSFVS